MTTKHFLLTVLLTLTWPTIVMADDSPINYDKTSAVRHATRRLNAISLAGATVSIPDNSLLYNDILRNGGAIADIDLVVLGSKPKSITITDITTEGGSVKYFDNRNMSEGLKHPHLTTATFLLAANRGYRPVGLKISNEDGEQIFSANNLNMFDIDGSLLSSNTSVMGLFEPVPEGELEEIERWKLVFNDEFNQADYTAPNSGKWLHRQRTKVTWARFISTSDSVAFIKDGALVLRTIKNPDTSTDDAAMLSGARQSNFNFKYGRAEARMKTTRHKGNFPAFWMMPTSSTGGWPACGEIDIMETINAENRAYFTIHSNWANTLGKSANPVKTSNMWINVEDWHIYAIEWDSLELRWYVDNQKVFTYPKRITNPNALENGQWPFDKEFYLIVNQSVGDGSWASAPDMDFVYETQVDWVRVYQKTPAVRTAYNEYMKYPTYFYRDQAVTHATRRLNSVSLNEQTVSIPDNTKMYNRINSNITFTAAAGDTVKPGFNYTGDWMNGYVYMDLNNNGKFDVNMPVNGVIATGSDLMSFSYYDGYNSAGEILTNKNTMEMPAFIIPESLKAGTYQMRYKVDWNDYTSAGSIAEGNDILTNGGAFADIKIAITDGTSTGINAMTVEGKTTDINTYYDLSGRKVPKPQKGIYIKNGKRYFIK
ncbi:MAG: glycoside hydrolase family 16 protein [Bacteroidaceae bacterium]|nr:glycoside hydrolase family 16 protein [Bacteroidaceae bacterium]